MNRGELSVKINSVVRDASGGVFFEDPLAQFLYELMVENEVAPGVLEVAARSSEIDAVLLARGEREAGIIYSNGWLATYAQHLAARLRDPLLTMRKYDLMSVGGEPVLPKEKMEVMSRKTADGRILKAADGMVVKTADVCLGCGATANQEAARVLGIRYRDDCGCPAGTGSIDYEVPKENK